MLKELEMFQNYLAEEEKSRVTISKYVRDAEQFLSFLGERELSKAETVAFKEMLIQNGYAAESVNSMISSVNSYLKFVSRPDCRIRYLRMQKKPFCPDDRLLTLEEYRRLVAAAGKGSRLCLVMETICSTGIRISELKYFTVEQIRGGEAVVRCKNKYRAVPIASKLRKKLLAYAKKKGIESGPVFVTKSGKELDRSNIWAEMKKICAKAGVESSKVFPHNLRKLFARKFYEKEKDIARLADILGHSNINTTRIYILTTLTGHRRLIEQLGLVI